MGPRLRSFLRVGDIAIPNQHDMFIGKFKMHRLVVLQRLLCEIVGKYTPFNGLLSDMLDVVLC